jgi:hypothetical protein
MAVAHLRCFDARLTQDDGRIKFHFWDRHNDFVQGVRKVPPYTDLFWAMFYKIAPFLGGMKKVILDAKTDEDVDEISKMRVRVAIPDDHDDGEFTTVEVPLLSHDVRAMIDNIIFVSCYGHKKMFEERVPRETIVAFRSCALKCAKEQEKSFYYLWKQYLARSGRSEEGAAAEKERVDQMHSMMGDDDEDGVFAGAGGAAAVAPARAGAVAGAAAAGDAAAGGAAAGDAAAGGAAAGGAEEDASQLDHDSD